MEATDKGKSTAKVETRVAVDVRTSTDSVYVNAGQKYDVKWPGGGSPLVQLTSRTWLFWNPQDNGRNISDMEDDGW